jgi:hypothetical protein
LKYFLHTPVGIILFSSFNSVSVIIFTVVSCSPVSPSVRLSACLSVPAAYMSETLPVSVW